MIFALEAEREFVRYRFPGECRPGIEKRLNAGSVLIGGAMGSPPVRITAAGDTSGRVDQVLGSECQSSKRAMRRTLLQFEILSAETAESARILRQHRHFIPA